MPRHYFLLQALLGLAVSVGLFVYHPSSDVQKMEYMLQGLGIVMAFSVAMRLYALATFSAVNIPLLLLDFKAIDWDYPWLNLVQLFEIILTSYLAALITSWCISARDKKPLKHGQPNKGLWSFFFFNLALAWMAFAGRDLGYSLWIPALLLFGVADIKWADLLDRRMEHAGRINALSRR